MRVRIVKKFYFKANGKNYTPNEIVHIDDETGTFWCKAGLAMQDKSLDGPSETKAEAPDGIGWHDAPGTSDNMDGVEVNLGETAKVEAPEAPAITTRAKPKTKRRRK